ncbi:hypothetical protein [Zoogloea sp.]|uniref:hypothetical protein n=1 Tax=Zoogloea sp. TaxID=49181 RepID=UPI002629C059|nr:hypothetical protein [Zoogloea sp.]MDD3355001.1 hypothetical protein [Zoogloea sp.]
MVVKLFAEGIDGLPVLLAPFSELEAEIGHIFLLTPANFFDDVAKQRVIVPDLNRNLVEEARGVYGIQAGANLYLALFEPAHDLGMPGFTGQVVRIMEIQSGKIGGCERE